MSQVLPSSLPSLNYNNPLVRRMFLDVVDFWMEHGVDAIRCDLAAFVPPSFWRAVRRLIIGRQPGGAMLPEIIPLWRLEPALAAVWQFFAQLRRMRPWEVEILSYPTMLSAWWWHAWHTA